MFVNPSENKQTTACLPSNKYLIKAKEDFEKLRKDELNGKMPIYPKIFLSSSFLSFAYQENLKLAMEMFQTFTRQITPNYNKRQLALAKRTKSKYYLITII